MEFGGAAGDRELLPVLLRRARPFSVPGTAARADGILRAPRLADSSQACPVARDQTEGRLGRRAGREGRHARAGVEGNPAAHAPL